MFLLFLLFEMFLLFENKGFEIELASATNLFLKLLLLLLFEILLLFVCIVTCRSKFDFQTKETFQPLYSISTNF